MTRRHESSNVGPFEYTPDNDISTGSTVIFDTRTENPENYSHRQPGYLKRYYGRRGGLDEVTIINNHSEPIRVKAGNRQTLVPPTMNVTLRGQGVEGASDPDKAGVFTQVEVTNPSGNSSAVSSSDLSVIFSNLTRREEQGGGRNGPTLEERISRVLGGR